jgi:hypothetical protein
VAQLLIYRRRVGHTDLAGSPVRPSDPPRGGTAGGQCDCEAEPSRPDAFRRRLGLEVRGFGHDRRLTQQDKTITPALVQPVPLPLGSSPLGLAGEVGRHLPGDTGACRASGTGCRPSGGRSGQRRYHRDRGREQTRGTGRDCPPALARPPHVVATGRVHLIQVRHQSPPTVESISAWVHGAWPGLDPRSKQAPGGCIVAVIADAAKSLLRPRFDQLTGAHP